MKAVIKMTEIDVSFAFYYNEFSYGNGGVLSEEVFEKYIEKAKSMLASFGVSYSESFLKDIRLCLCEIAEVLYTQDKIGKLKSEAIDGYTATYQEKQNIRKDVSEIALRRLGASGLLYAGVM